MSIRIPVPPLRERREDIDLISTAVLERIAREAGVVPPPSLAPDARGRLARYAFPGNVRELENLLHRAVAMASGDLISGDDLGLPDTLFVDSGPEAGGSPEGAPDLLRPERDDALLPADLAAHLDAVERDILSRALEQHGFNRTAAGARLGLSLRQMRYRMARAGHHRRRGRAGQRPGRRGVTPSHASGDAAWREGWWKAARPCPSPNVERRPEGAGVELVVLHSISLPPGEYGGDAVERLFMNQLDWDAHPYYQGLRGLRVSAHFLVPTPR